MYRTIILQFVLCGYVILTLTWTEERVPSVLHYRLLRKIFGPKGGEVSGKWRRLHRKDLHYRYSSSTKYFLSYKIKKKVNCKFKFSIVILFYVIHTIKPKKLILKLYFLPTICHNSDMFRSTLIIFRELPNISKTYVKAQMDYWKHYIFFVIYL
jgi:hypothetical protein